MDRNVQRLKALNIRSDETKNLFVLTCWKWLRDMKILQPHIIWNDLKFAKWYLPHSLSRRLGIVLRCKEIANEDATNKLPDRFRRYWKKHPEFFDAVFNQNEPVFMLPFPTYEFPIFKLNNPYPTIQSATPGINVFFI